MLRKSCKSAIVIVSLFLLVNFDLSASVGVVDIDTGRFGQTNEGVINISLLERNSNHTISANLIDERGNVVAAINLSNNFSAKATWKVKSGTYKVVLVNTITGEKEIHYAII